MSTPKTTNPSQRKKKKKNVKKKTAPIRRQRKAGPRKFNAVRMGQRVGNLFGKPAGLVGAEAGRLFRQVTGYGDYKVTGNSLLSSMDRLPTFVNKSYGSRILHREFLFDVVTSDAAGQFKIQSVPIQPALLASFPWLSASAENYQEYQLNGAVYEFKSNSYDALGSTNTASGTVIMATDYNALDLPFVNKFQMEQTQFTCSGKPSINLMHPIECAKIETPSNTLYTRSGPVTTGDLRLYDWGNFQIATVGMQGTSVNVGELWITYDITLLKPKLTSTVDVSDHYVLPIVDGKVTFVPGGPAYFGSLANPFLPIKTIGSDMGTFITAFDNFGLDTINWPPGYTGNVCVIYRSELKSTVSATLATPYSYVLVGGIATLNVFGGAGTSVNFNNEGDQPMTYNANGATTLVIMVSVVNGGSLRLKGGTTGTGPLSGDLMCIALPTNFTRQLPLPALLAPHFKSVTWTDTVSHLISDGEDFIKVRERKSHSLK